MMIRANYQEIPWADLNEFEKHKVLKVAIEILEKRNGIHEETAQS